MRRTSISCPLGPPEPPGVTLHLLTSVLQEAPAHLLFIWRPMGQSSCDACTVPMWHGAQPRNDISLRSLALPAGQRLSVTANWDSVPSRPFRQRWKAVVKGRVHMGISESAQTWNDASSSSPVPSCASSSLTETQACCPHTAHALKQMPVTTQGYPAPGLHPCQDQ